MTIGQRIRLIRKHCELNQTEFGDRIGLKQTAIGLYENDQRGVADRTILLICEKYGVSEEWLRTGEGEMFVESDSTIISQLAAEHGLDAFERAMVKSFLHMRSDQREILKAYVKSLLNEVLNDAEAYKDFREEYISDRRVLPFAARHGDASNLAETAELYDNARREEDESSET